MYKDKIEEYFNIHKDDVVFRPVILYDLHTVGKKGKTKALAAFGFIALEKVYQLAAVGIVVLYDSNADQGAHPLKVVSIFIITRNSRKGKHISSLREYRLSLWGTVRLISRSAWRSPPARQTDPSRW